MYRHHYQCCPTHGREFCPDVGCRTQRVRAASGPSTSGSPPAPRTEMDGDPVADTDRR